MMAPAVQSPTYVSIEERTSSCLDFNVILQYLRDETVTIEGSETCLIKYCNTSYDASLQYEMVDQLSVVLGKCYSVITIIRSFDYA